MAALGHKYGININLNVIVRGAKDKTSDYYLNTVGRILLRYMPASTEMYFWTPYPGTRSFAEFNTKFPAESYRLLSDFHFKSESSPLRDLHQRKLLALQVKYYQSKEYAKMRNFNCGDSLSLRINELWTPARKRK